MTLDAIQRYTVARFPTREEALAFDSAILDAAESPEGMLELLTGEMRAVVFSTSLFDGRAGDTRYLSPGAVDFAHRNGIRYVPEMDVWRDELPEDLVMVVGAYADLPE